MTRDYPDEDLEILHLHDNDYEIDESDFLETGEIPVIKDDTVSRKPYYAQEDEDGIYDIGIEEEDDYDYDYEEDESDYIDEGEPDYTDDEPDYIEEGNPKYVDDKPDCIDEGVSDYEEETRYTEEKAAHPVGEDEKEPEPEQDPGADEEPYYDPESELLEEPYPDSEEELLDEPYSGPEGELLDEPYPDSEEEPLDEQYSGPEDEPVDKEYSGPEPEPVSEGEPVTSLAQPSKGTILGPKVVLDIPQEQEADLQYEAAFAEPGMGDEPTDLQPVPDNEREPGSEKKAGNDKPKKQTVKKKKTGSGKKKNRRRKKRKGKGDTLHNVLIILLIILLIGAVIAGVRLYFWDMGKESEYDPDNITDEFDVETEDYLLPLSPQMAELRKDDGVNSILIFGNDLIANDRGRSDGIAALIEKYTGGKVYDATIKNTFMSIKNPQLDEGYIDDIYSLYWLVQCIKLNEFEPLKNYAPGWDGDENITEIVDMLSNLDMSTIDTIFIMYDFHDYSEGRMLASPVDDQFPVSASACLGLSLMGIKQTFPHIRVVVGSPYFSYANGESGETADFGYGVLGDFMISYKNVAVNNDASFIDNYFGSITVDNYKEYLDDDYEYPNKEGKEILAKRAADFIGRATD